VSIGPDGIPGNAPSQDAVIANPGLEVAFQSHAGNLNSSPADPAPKGGVSRVLYARTIQPRIVLPRNGQEFPLSTPTTITFSWTALTGVAQYGFEFTGANRQFANPNGTAPDAVNGLGGAGGGFLVPGTTFTTALPDFGPATNQVRVIGMTESGQPLGTFSDGLNLLFEPAIALPPDIMPVITVPPGGSIVARGSSVTFSWTALPGVTQYGVEFTGPDREFANPNGSGPDAVKGFGGAGGGFGVAGTSFPALIPPGTLPGRYQVRVIGLSQTGTLGRFSDAITVIVQ